jgi:hypothetical protein
MQYWYKMTGKQEVIKKFSTDVCSSFAVERLTIIDGNLCDDMGRAISCNW